MYVDKALSGKQSTHGLLNKTPLRPCALRGVVRELRAYNKTGKVLSLLGHIFPDESKAVIYDDKDWLLDVTWVNKLYYLFGLIESADYFEIDKELINWLYNGWLYEDAPYFSEIIAHFLDYMPVVFHGTGSKVVLDGCEGISILTGLLHVDYGLDSDFLIAYEIYDNLYYADKRDMYDKLLTKDFGSYDAPLCYLPEIARVVVKETANLILDNDQADLESEDWMQYPLLSWRDDLIQVRNDWHAAKPVIERLNAFMDWLNEDEANIRRMVGLVLDEYEL